MSNYILFHRCLSDTLQRKCKINNKIFQPIQAVIKLTDLFHMITDLTSQSEVWGLSPAVYRKEADRRLLASLCVWEGQHNLLPGGGDTASVPPAEW